jgi:hypothetical protein
VDAIVVFGSLDVVDKYFHFQKIDYSEPLIHRLLARAEVDVVVR